MMEPGQNRKMKILMAIDNSGYKHKIIRSTIQLAKALNAEVIVIHILTKASMGTVGDLLGYYRGGHIEAYMEELRKQAEKLVDEARDIGTKEGISMDTAVLTHSSAADAIINYSKEHQIDLIVIGTRGMTGIEKFLVGSVANNVIGHASCSVLAIR